jgi:hypothetical protein
MTARATPGAQLKKFLDVLAAHRKQLESQMTDLQANLDELKTHEKEAARCWPRRPTRLPNGQRPEGHTPIQPSLNRRQRP